MSNTCPICGTEALSGPENQYDCPLCGHYQLGAYVIGAMNKEYYMLTTTTYNISKLKSALFYYLRVLKKNHTNLNNTIQIYAKKSDTGIDLDSIYKLYPTTFSKRIDMVMELLNTSIVDIGDRCSDLKLHQGNQPIAHRFALSSDDSTSKQIEYIFKLLNEKGYLDGKQEDFTFTTNGWNKIDSLQRNQKSTTAFIAMSFSTEDPRLPIAEESIKSAITRAGYIPMIVKDTEHNQSIPQEIDYEIRNATFVVADLTTQNNGAYYEAGLAKGYGKDVIFTCHKDDFENIHFDTKQIITIKWSEAEAFTEALFKRIKYTVGVYSQIK